MGRRVPPARGAEARALSSLYMAYFVTGATGFLGRLLLERLLAGRDGKVYVLVRESSGGVWMS